MTYKWTDTYGTYSHWEVCTVRTHCTDTQNIHTARTIHTVSTIHTAHTIQYAYAQQVQHIHTHSTNSTYSLDSLCDSNSMSSIVRALSLVLAFLTSAANSSWLSTPVVCYRGEDKEVERRGNCWEEVKARRGRVRKRKRKKKR